MIRRPCWKFRLFGRCSHKPEWYSENENRTSVFINCAREADRAKQICGHCRKPMGVTPYFTYEDEQGNPLHCECYWEPIDNDPERAAAIVRCFKTGVTQVSS